MHIMLVARLIADRIAGLEERAADHRTTRHGRDPGLRATRRRNGDGSTSGPRVMP